VQTNDTKISSQSRKIRTTLLFTIRYGDAKWVIGWAMVGRAEFAYLIAQLALAGDMMTKECFSIVIWALVLATLTAPAGFGYYLKK
jgi:hypothetical protein